MIAVRAVLGVAILVSPPLLPGAAACVCMLKPPCQAVWEADAVFVGTVVDITMERVGGNLNWVVHKVALNQALRGSVGAFITLTSTSLPDAEAIEAARAHPGELTRASGCDYDFERGRQYIIYARRAPDGSWTTGKCSGTKRIEKAAADLDYFAQLPAANPSGRVYGRVERLVHDSNDRTKVVPIPAAGVSVSLASQSTQLTVTTDSGGKVDVQLPPGEYTRTDAIGAFQLRALSGVRYVFRANARLSSGVKRFETRLLVNYAMSGLRVRLAP